jgi:hypothetical protein
VLVVVCADQLDDDLAGINGRPRQFMVIWEKSPRRRIGAGREDFGGS